VLSSGMCARIISHREAREREFVDIQLARARRSSTFHKRVIELATRTDFERNKLADVGSSLRGAWAADALLPTPDILHAADMFVITMG
jgi:hypothetical protein